MRICNKTMSGGTVRLDDNHYVRCRMEHATLVYCGGTVPIFEDCTIDGCDWRLIEAAGRTLEFLQTLNAMDGGGTLIEKAFPIIIAPR